MTLPQIIRRLAWWKKPVAATPVNTQIFGKNLVPIRAIHMAILEMLKSPFLDSLRMAQALGRAQKEEDKKAILAAANTIEMSLLDICQVIIVFSLPAGEETSRIMNHRDGCSVILAEAKAFMDTLPPLHDFEVITSCLASHYTCCLISHMEMMAQRAPVRSYF